MPDIHMSEPTPFTYNIMTLSGQAQVTALPDTAVVRLGVQTSGVDPKTIQEANASASQAIVDALWGMGINNIRTVQYSVDKNYEYENGKQIDRGFTITSIMEIQTDQLDAVGTVIDTAIAAGANVVDLIAFEASDLSFYYQLALNKALMNAIEKARTISESLGLQTNLVPVRIEENSEGALPAHPFQRELAATPIIPGDMTIEASVTAVFAY